jgi:hypothetical protein
MWVCLLFHHWSSSAAPSRYYRISGGPLKFGRKILLLYSWDWCYDHNFLRFLTIFGEKNWRFSQKPMLWSNICII